MIPYSPPSLAYVRPPGRNWAPFQPPKLGATAIDEIKERAWEFEEPLKFLAVAWGWVAGDLVGHQLFKATEGAKTPPTYYRNKLLLAPVLLLGARIVSDLVGGSPFVRALTIGTTANLAMQVKYLTSGLSPEFNAEVFLLHEILLVPLSLLIVGKPGQVLFFKEPGGY